MELLTRLDAKVQSWLDSGNSYDPLTPSQISAACHNANPIGLMVLQWRVGQITPSRGYYSLYNAIIGIGVREGWRTARKDVGEQRIRLLMEICLDDYAKPLKCRTCNGTGENELHKDCETCEGSGNRERSDYSRSQQLGIHRNNYKKTWVSRYRKVMDYLLDTLPELEYQAKKKIRKNLKEGLIKGQQQSRVYI